MSRTAEELMTHHIESMMKMKENSNLDEALADYSEDLVDMIRLPIPCEILLLLRQSWEWMWSRLLKNWISFFVRAKAATSHF